MAIDYNTGISSIDAGAPEIKYTGDEGPRSPEENKEIASAILGDEMGEVASQLWNGMSPPEKSEWRSIEGFIQSEDFKIILMQLQSNQQGRGGIQMASAADPLLQEEYDKYVFEMEEQGLKPMPLEEFKQEAVAGMATGGRAGYKDGEMVTVPKHWQSAPDHPKTELAYITKAEKDLLVKKDLHNSLKDGPNVGPGGVMSLNGGYNEPGGFRSGSEMSHAEQHGTFGPGAKADKQSEGIRAGFIAAGGDGGKPGKDDSPEVKKQIKEIKKASKKRKEEAKEEEKVSLKENFKQKSSDFRKRELRNLFDYIYGGRKFQMPGWSTLTRKPQYGESWYTDPDLLDMDYEELGISAEDYYKLQDIQKTLGQEYVGQTIADDDEFAFQDFYPNMNKPQLGGDDNRGPDPLWQRLGYPNEAAYLMAQGTGTTATPAAITTPATGTTGTSSIATGPITGQLGGISPQHQAILQNIYGGTLPTMFAADGGRAGYAGGGIADLRQGYFLGKLVKSVTKGAKKAVKSIGKVAKSPIGLAALSYFAPQLMGKFIPGMENTGWGGNFLSKLGTSIEGNPFPWIAGASALGGLYTAMGDDEDEDELYKKWLADKKAADEYWIPKFDPSNFRRITSADGGKIGYNEGENDDEEDRVAAIRALSYRPGAQEGGLMDLGGMEKDYRNEGGFVPIGGQERADDVPARLSKNEFVFTADAVRNAGGGDIDKGAEIMENLMENLEQGGKVSEESQGLEGARDMFATAQRLEGVL